MTLTVDKSRVSDPVDKSRVSDPVDKSRVSDQSSIYIQTNDGTISIGQIFRSLIDLLAILQKSLDPALFNTFLYERID